MNGRIRTAGAAVLAALALVVAACAGRHAAHSDPGEVKVMVARVGYDRISHANFVLLADRSRRDVLPILIGQSEARAILLAMHGVRTPRPLTADLLRNVIAATGNRVDRVVITGLKGETYYADIYLDHGRYRIDSRPSDAIALAMGSDAPIYVARKLLKPAAATLGGALPETASALGLTVQVIDEELAHALGVKPRTGLLIAEATGDAAHQGIAAGDVLASVGSSQTTTLGEFERAAQALKPGSKISVVVIRNGKRRQVSLTVTPPAAGRQ